MFSVHTTAVPANVFVTGKTPSLHAALSDGNLVQSMHIHGEYMYLV